MCITLAVSNQSQRPAAGITSRYQSIGRRPSRALPANPPTNRLSFQLASAATPIFASSASKNRIPQWVGLHHSRHSVAYTARYRSTLLAARFLRVPSAILRKKDRRIISASNSLTYSRLSSVYYVFISARSNLNGLSNAHTAIWIYFASYRVSSSSLSNLVK